MSIVEEAFNRGMSSLLEFDISNEKDKVGFLRGGSSGIYIKEKKQTVGECMRIAFLRMKGVRISSIDPATKLMFQAGIANEDKWYETIKGGWPNKILREEEISTYWKTNNGTEVTGRPDIVLLNQYEEPEVGIELKLVSSLWTARDVLFEGRPKYNHLIQAAHYSWQLGVPFELWYTSRLKFATNDMVNRLLPKYGTAKYNQLKDFLEIRFYKQVVSRTGSTYGKQITEEEFLSGKQGYREGEVYASSINIQPFTIGYTMEWSSDNKLTYESCLTKERFKTEITADRIKAFYEHVSTMQQTKDLGPRPTTLKGDGTKAGYSQCQYCPLDKICDKVSSLDSFITEVEKVKL